MSVSFFLGERDDPLLVLLPPSLTASPHPQPKNHRKGSRIIFFCAREGISTPFRPVHLPFSAFDRTHDSLLSEQRTHLRLRKQAWVSLTSGPPRPSALARVSAVGKLSPPQLPGAHGVFFSPCAGSMQNTNNELSIYPGRLLIRACVCSGSAVTRRRTRCIEGVT